MVFSSTIFLFAFLPITLAGYYLIRKELKNVFLLIMSLLFYAVGEPSFVWVMMGSILANYILGLLIWKTERTSSFLRRLVLVLAVSANLAILFYYKYYDFAAANINGLLRTNIPLRNVVLPIGISFFTFQGMSYVLDVYMKKTEVQKNPLHVALYIALFPQLIAGPIVRYSDINEQIVSRTETLSGFAAGVQRFAVGLTKKIVLSNTFALLADQSFGTSVNELGVGLAWLGALAYALQIYFDFSGYSDMAIGLGKMFGFNFLENFNYPYISTNITGFWRRWHISLSSWFRDYVYIPLGGNRKGNVYLHLLTVFFLTGMWHGASWNFIVWGLWHGLFLLVERILRNKGVNIPVPKVLKWLYTMVIVLVGWVLFRAADLTSALEYLGCMVGMGGGIDWQTAWYAICDYGITFIVGFACMLPVIPKIKELRDTYIVPNRLCKFLEPVLCGVLLLVGAAYTVTSTYNPFIYFNF